MRPGARGVLLIVVSAVSFGGVGVLTKLALAAGLPPSTLLLWRWLLAGSALGLLLAFRAAPAADSGRVFGVPRPLAALLVGAFGYAGTSGVYTLSLQTIPASLASFLLFSSPALVAVAAPFFLGEHLGRWGLASLGLALGGVALLTLAPGIVVHPGGVLLALGSAVAYAGTVLASRRVIADAPPLPLALWAMAGAALATAAVALARGEAQLPPSREAWFAVGALAVVSTSLSVATFYAGLPLVGAARASVISTLEPVATFAVAYAVLGELLSGVQLFGAGLVLAAVGVLAAERRASGKS